MYCVESIYVSIFASDKSTPRSRIELWEDNEREMIHRRGHNTDLPASGPQIVTHDSHESLHKHVPKECLPSDLGGDLPHNMHEYTRTYLTWLATQPPKVASSSTAKSMIVFGLQ